MLLRGYRILDLTDAWGALAGKLLADLGAEVIAVEPPGGNPLRRMGPFLPGHPDFSFAWLAFSAGKKSVVLDLGREDGRRLFLRLVALSDAVLESFPPGTLDRLGLGWDALRRANPTLVLGSVTPFGPEGPFAGWQASDLVISAAGGLLYLSGDPDRPPVRTSVPQTYPIAGSALAGAVASALFRRTRTGQGGRVEVSAQHAVARSLDRVPIFWERAQVLIRRHGTSGLPGGGAPRRIIWRCRDGWIAFTLIGGATGARVMDALARWMEEEGEDPGPIRAQDWGRMAFGLVPEETIQTVTPLLERFFGARTRQQLWEGAQRHRVLVYPVLSPGETFRFVQEMYPALFPTVPGPEGPLYGPSPFLRLGEGTPPAGAPALGEHTAEVLQDLLGLTPRDLLILKEGGALG